MPDESGKKKVLENFAGDRQLVISAYEAFLPMIPKYVEEISQAIDNKQAEALHFAAHTFQGSASNFQPVKLVRILKDLVKASKNSSFSEAILLLAELNAELPHFQERMTLWTSHLTDQIADTIPLPVGGKLLVVDDDVFGGNLTAAKLRASGFDVDMISDPTGLSDHLELIKYDLIILDLYLKNISGLDILKDLRKTHTPFQLPIVILTGSDAANDVVECLRAGANDFVTKPLVLEVTVARIKMQLMIKNLYSRSVAAKQAESISKMIVTYNHEINNPLSIALGFIGRLKKQTPSRDIQKAEDALLRIQKIVKKISEIESDSESIEYMDQSKMFKVR